MRIAVPICRPRAPHLLIAFTSSGSVAFYSGLYKRLLGRGIHVSVVSSTGPELDQARLEGASVCPVPMKREISPWHDLVSLWRLYRLMLSVRPDITNVGTPKAGLLGGLAALMAGIPHRVYTLHGLRLETTQGTKRRLLMFTERLACFCAHRVYCVSPSLRNRAIDLGLVKPEKTVIVGPGTCRGVDAARLRASKETQRDADVLRRRLEIEKDERVIGFVGRFTRDKGVSELYRSFVQLRARHSNLRLLLVGDYERGDPIDEATRMAIEGDSGVLRTGFVPDVSDYYHVMDICVLPTHREGFPGVLLEAQAAGVAVVTTDATGAIDAVLDRRTGLIVPVGDVNALCEAIGSLLADSALRKRMGEAGRAWVESTFQKETVWAAYLETYEEQLSLQGFA